jgi:hypothetical protein
MLFPIICLPGQGCVLHDFISIPVPTQSTPYTSGVGLSHCRVLYIRPLPHVFEHTDSDQSDQPPFTVKQYVNKVHFFQSVELEFNACSWT